MKNPVSITVLAVTAMLSFSLPAMDTTTPHDARAVEVLQAMSDYKASLDSVVISGSSINDARLDAGLIVSNSNEMTVTVKRPASLHFKNFDGINTMELYFHQGLLTVFDSGTGFYAQANIPEKIDAALDFALAELDVDAPLMDLVRADVFDHLIETTDSVMYLTDKSRVMGSDCHHIAIRSAEVDVQLWIQEGNQPVPRRIMITSKWEGGAPRFLANMNWDTKPDIKSGTFDFKAPEGVSQIQFVNPPATAE